MQWFPVQTRRFPLGKHRIPLGIRGYRSGLPVRKFFFIFWVPKQSNIWTCSILEWCMSSLLSYHIFSFFISKYFENFKFRRNFLKFTAGMGYRLVAVSGKFGGNRRLPTGKVNPGEATGQDGAWWWRARGGGGPGPGLVSLSCRVWDSDHHMSVIP